MLFSLDHIWGTGPDSRVLSYHISTGWASYLISKPSTVITAIGLLVAECHVQDLWRNLAVNVSDARQTSASQRSLLQSKRGPEESTVFADWTLKGRDHAFVHALVSYGTFVGTVVCTYQSSQSMFRLLKIKRSNLDSVWPHFKLELLELTDEQVKVIGLWLGYGLFYQNLGWNLVAKETVWWCGTFKKNSCFSQEIDIVDWIDLFSQDYVLIGMFFYFLPWDL